MKALNKAVFFHGHLCPGLAIGVRVSELALRLMGKRSKDEEIVAIVENDSCAVDAVQALTGCTSGKGNLIFRDYGKHVYTFIRRPSGEALRISLAWEPPEDTEKVKAAWTAYQKGDRSGHIIKGMKKRKADRLKALLDASDEELFIYKRLKMKVPDEARIYPSVSCSRCGEGVMEPRARVKNGKLVCIPCFEKGK